MHAEFIARVDKKFVTAALGIALLFGSLCVFQHVYQRLDTTYPFKGVDMLQTDQEFYYAARAKEVEDGFWSVANAYHSQPKDQPYLQPSFPEFSIVMTGKLFGLNAIHSFIVAKAVFGFLVVLSLMFLVHAVTHDKWLSLAATTGVLFAGAIFSAPWDIGKYLFDPLMLADFLRFSRPISPLWFAPFTFLSLGLIAQYWQYGKRWHLLVAAVCTSILLYSYVYAWTFIGATMAVLFCVALARKDRKKIQDFLLFAFIFFVLSLPYLHNMWLLSHHPWYAETAGRQGLVHKREMVLGVWALAFPVIALLGKRLWKSGWIVVLALAIAGIVALNHQLITGLFLVPHHYHWYFVQPLAAVFFSSLILGEVKQRKFIPSKLFTIGVSALVVIAIGFGMYHQYRSTLFWRKDWGERQELAPLFAFLRERCEPSRVVFATEETVILRDLVAVETSCDVYSAGNANGYLTPTERARNSYFFLLWLSGFTPEEAKKRFPTDLRYTLSSRLHSIYYRELTGQYDAIPEAEVQENIALYAQYYAMSLEDRLAVYPIDYVIFTPDDTDTREWKSMKARGTKIYDRNGYQIFSLSLR